MAGAVACRVADSRSLLRGERRREGDSAHEVRDRRPAAENSVGTARRLYRAVGAVHRGDLGGRGLAVPDEEPERTGSTELPDPAQQPDRSTARGGAELRRPTNRAVVRGVRRSLEGTIHATDQTPSAHDDEPAKAQRIAARGGAQGDREQRADRV